MIDTSGTFDSCMEPPCPVCGEPLGYYAEFGDEIECGNCGCKMKLDYETIIHYEIYEVGKVINLGVNTNFHIVEELNEWICNV